MNLIHALAPSSKLLRLLLSALVCIGISLFGVFSQAQMRGLELPCPATESNILSAISAFAPDANVALSQRHTDATYSIWTWDQRQGQLQRFSLRPSTQPGCFLPLQRPTVTDLAALERALNTWVDELPARLRQGSTMADFFSLPFEPERIFKPLACSDVADLDQVQLNNQPYMAYKASHWGALLRAGISQPIALNSAISQNGCRRIFHRPPSLERLSLQVMTRLHDALSTQQSQRTVSPINHEQLELSQTVAPQGWSCGMVCQVGMWLGGALVLSSGYFLWTAQEAEWERSELSSIGALVPTRDNFLQERANQGHQRSIWTFGAGSLLMLTSAAFTLQF
jgi:hypothetical protein